MKHSCKAQAVGLVGHHGLMAPIVALALAACGDGGSSGGSPSVAPRDYYQVYGTYDSSDVTLVDVADFSRRRTLHNALVLAVLDTGIAEGSLVRYSRPHSMLFRRNGALYRLGLRHGDSPTPVRISGETLVDPCSDSVVQISPTTTAGAVVFYSFAGPDRECFTDDDFGRMFDFNGGPSSTSSAYPFAPGWRGEFRDSDGSLLGLIVHGDDDKLHLHDAGFAESAQVDAVTSFQLLHGEGTVALANINGQIRKVDASGALGSVLHTADGWIRNFQEDDTYLYFVDGSGPQKVYRLQLDGSADAELLTTLTGYYEAFMEGQLPDALVVKASSDGGQQHLLLVDKDTVGGDPAVADSWGDGVLSLFHPVTRGSPFLYRIEESTGPGHINHARYLDAAGALHTFGPDTRWAGLVRSDTVLARPPLSIYPVFTSNPVGAFLWNSAASTASLMRFDGGGALEPAPPAAVEGRVYFYATSGLGMGTTEDTDPPDYQSDVFSFDLEQGRFHTQYTPASEFVIAW